MPTNNNFRKTYASNNVKKLRVRSLSEAGPRSENQDTMLVIPELHFYAIADGMGGHKGGRECSQGIIKILEAVARNVLLPSYTATDTYNIQLESEVLRSVVKQINEKILQESTTGTILEDAGSTLTILRLFPKQKQYIIAHVGDTRVTRCRKRKVRDKAEISITPLTRDQNAVIQGVVQKNVLNNCMGGAHRPHVTSISSYEGNYQDDDLFIVSSDGMHDYIDPETLYKRFFYEHFSLSSLKTHIAQACEAHSQDNYSFVLIEV